MAAGIEEPTGKAVGTTTIGATGGTALAGAVALIVVWAVSLTGLDVPDEVQSALVVILASVGALIGGKVTPSNQVRTIWGSAPSDLVTPPATFIDPAVDDTPPVDSVPVDDGAAQLAAEVDAVRGRHASTGSTTVGGV